MKLFKSNILIVQRASPAKAGKRFVSLFIDFVLVAFVTFLINLISMPVAQNTKSYQEATSTLKAEVAYYNDYISKTSIVSFLDEEKTIRKDSDIMVLENISRAVYRSLDQYPNEYITLKDDDKIKEFGMADKDTDVVSNFYLNYLEEHNKDESILINKYNSYQQLLFETYKDAFGNDADIFFVFNYENDIPVLNSSSARFIYHYLFISQEDAIGQTGKEYYDAFYMAYVKMLDDAEYKMIYAEPYYSTHYVSYKQCIEDQSRILNLALVISILIAYLIVVVFVRFIFADGVSLGYKINALAVVNNNKSKVQWYKILLNSLLGMIGFISVAIINYLFVPFNGVYGFMSFPLIGNISLLNIIVIASIISIVSGFFILFTHRKISLFNMIFHTEVVDLRHLDEGDNDDQYEGKGN